MMIRPIKKQSVTDEVYDQISNLIISREWLPGDKIPSENELGLMFNVSRVSIRAALQKLIAIGLLESRMGEGTFVIKSTPANYFRSLIPNMVLTKLDDKAILELRRGIETESIMLAAERATQEDIERIESIARHMNELIKQDDLSEYIIADFNFHMEIAKASKNALLLEVMVILKDLLFVHYTDLVKNIGPHFAYDYHEEMLEAIKEKNTSKAVEAVRNMVQNLISKLDDIGQTKYK